MSQPRKRRRSFLPRRSSELRLVVIFAIAVLTYLSSQSGDKDGLQQLLQILRMLGGF